MATRSTAVLAPPESTRPTVRDDTGRLVALAVAACRDEDVHSRPTRVVLARGSASDLRVLGCGSCGSVLDRDAQFCGMCGTRAQRRHSLTGTVVDGLYAIEDRLADGGTAAVYRARHLPSGHVIALKILHAELAYDPDVVARFRREGKCLARLRDAHTVRVLDHGEDAEGTLFIAMELLRCESLDVRMRTRGAMPWREALAIMRDVCSSLFEAHDHGIVHRALTPRNIQLDARGAVKVIDFGLARLQPDAVDEDPCQAIGSPQYRAPEQGTGEAYDGRADIYALAVIVLELLLGQLRRPGAPPARLPAEIPSEVERLLERCLAPEPHERTPSVAELANEIDQVLQPVARMRPARRIFAHTSAFELQPPRIVIAACCSEPAIATPPATPVRWKLWAAAIVACGFALGSAVVGCV